MKIPPFYTVTSEMVELIAKIEAIRIYLVSLRVQKQVKEKIQRVSLLKSSLFSARIEGNTLDLSDLEQGKKLEQEKTQEVFNIIKASGYVNGKVKKGVITKNILLELHKRISNITQLLSDLLTYIDSSKEKFPLVTAIVAHLVFEKIHPFLDGNGRVGRLLIAAVLKAKNWDFTFTVPFEEYLDEHKDEYYSFLSTGLQNTNDYLLFMLKAFLQEIEKIKTEIDGELTKKEKIFLPPRQEEIFDIIKDHSVVSFDMIRRRFLKVPKRTLRYDLKKLLDRKIIEKSGETRARYYRVKNE